MSRTDLLGAELHEKTRWFRVRWILALDEIAKLGRAATWDEWNKIWFRGERHTTAAANRALARLCADLRELGVRLHCCEARFVDGRGGRLRALLEPWLERARRLDEEIEARRRLKYGIAAEEREDDLADDAVGENVVLDPEVVVDEYRNRSGNISEIARLHRIGCGRVLKILRARGVVRERWEQPRALERTRPEYLLAEALAAFDSGGGIKDVARILACSIDGAWNFLRRSGRTTDSAAAGTRSWLSRAPVDRSSGYRNRSGKIREDRTLRDSNP